MKSAYDWKEFYARERAALGTAGLHKLLDAAASVTLPHRGALVFPHTHLAGAGKLIATAARAALQFDEVLALGVLHSARRCDAALVQLARNGDVVALNQLRKVHGAEDTSEYCKEEFSLDAFEALLTLAAQTVGRKPPRLYKRYPFLVGDRPNDLPGIDELHRLAERGCAMVVTTDPLHHGHGYGTPAAELLPRENAKSVEFTRRSIDQAFGYLSRKEYAAFHTQATTVRSDFKDTGPILAELLRPGFKYLLHDLKLTDYSAILGAPEPTWVAAALVECGI